MEAVILNPSSWIGADKAAKRRNASLRLSLEESAIPIRKVNFPDSRLRAVSIRSSRAARNLSCACSSSGGSGSEIYHVSLDEALVIKRKAENAAHYLNGRCIYLIGMMGSGKTTVGKILSEVLDYSFFDSDKLVEQAVGITSVAQIFKEHSEAFFRDNESKVLRDLSSMSRLVVATGGGAVIRPINWRYMKQGVIVWLDVPLEALARRIAAVGTDSRPLLEGESNDPYTRAFMRLTALSEERGKDYANADARVCLEYIADKQGHKNVCALTPTAIAIEALTKIESFLSKQAAGRRSWYLQDEGTKANA